MPSPSSALRVVELACRAPSVHNSQPWRWRVDGDRVELYADRSRQLPVADPDGRSLLLSCGAALHHALVAATGLGYAVAVTRHPDPERPDLLATLELSDAVPTPDAVAALQALLTRRTDRRRFTSWPVPEEHLAELAAGVSGREVQVVPLTSAADRIRAELLTGRAASAQEADGRYAAEERQWTDRPRSDTVEGSDGLLAVCTVDDDPRAWLAAGETLSALWLRAAQEGLSVVPLSHVVEVAETRAALHHEVLGGLTHPQLLLRLRWQEIGVSDLPATPRRALVDVVLDDPSGPEQSGTKVPATGAVRPVR